MRGRRVTALVGREQELALSLRRWHKAKEGEGQVALVSGEAGIGKSRVLAALRERIGDEPHVMLRYQCSPHHVNDAFYPVTARSGVARVLSAANRPPRGWTSWRR